MYVSENSSDNEEGGRKLEDPTPGTHVMVIQVQQETPASRIVMTPGTRTAEPTLLLQALKIHVEEIPEFFQIYSSRVASAIKNS
jgi:hypothetical protein